MFPWTTAGTKEFPEMVDVMSSKINVLYCVNDELSKTKSSPVAGTVAGLQLAESEKLQLGDG